MLDGDCSNFWGNNTLYNPAPSSFTVTSPAQGVILTIHLHLALRVRVSGAIPPFLHTFSWRGQEFLFYLSPHNIIFLRECKRKTSKQNEMTAKETRRSEIVVANHLLGAALVFFSLLGVSEIN